MKKLNKKGFTLVELLAVIVILALLMVVATRTIGGSLTSSKKSAMKSEALKIVSKTYEDIQMSVINGGTVSYTYKNTKDDTNKVIKFTDGDYEIKITVDNITSPTMMKKVCIKQGNKYGVSEDIQDGTVSFEDGKLYTDTAC